MEENLSLTALTTLVQKKIKKKILVKVIWNEQEKMTLFITPNMKINSFIYDEKEGYIFYDITGKAVDYEIPCILTEDQLIDGKVKIEGLKINNVAITKKDLEEKKMGHN
ncbi:hypothetical protein [Ornithinibacillus halophilus]|uniref:Uncharacterized protein n=1 Tax=Ornithinibacillus halophilus TaxID=930117 RepID=A0A1M5IMY2_9BACI|nr:hypothetical protein [Ornithinibacillus halophilus]SHG29601.1 hypothetical protein SAMN05216225_10254 [Ornithinibacillus halophilus]